MGFDNFQTLEITGAQHITAGGVICAVIRRNLSMLSSSRNKKIHLNFNYLPIIPLH